MKEILGYGFFIVTSFLLYFVQNLYTIILFVVGLQFILFKLYFWIANYIKEEREYKEEKRKYNQFAENFLADKLNYDTYRELSNAVSGIKHVYWYADEKYQPAIEKKRTIVENLLEKLKGKEELDELEKKKTVLKKEIEVEEGKKKELLQTDGEKRDEILFDLDIDENNVLLEGDLTDEQMKLLSEEGFKKTNQYSIVEEKVISAYVKPILNHSKTHIFLVWEIVKILKDLYDIPIVYEHLTKDADITFKYKNKLFALEVETGTSLKKKKQMDEKIKSLNRKYKGKWMFVVSNKNLYTEYKKLGFTTQRKSVEKNLNKLLKIDTQKEWLEK